MFYSYYLALTKACLNSERTCSIYEMSFEENIFKIFKILVKFSRQLDLFGFGIPRFFKYMFIIRFTVKH